MACNPDTTITNSKLSDFNTNINVFNQVITSDDPTTPDAASDGEHKTTLAGIEQIALGKARTSAPVSFVDGTFDYTISGFNASLSAYYAYSPDGIFPTQLLIPDVDYTFADTVTQTITLASSWSGGKIIAKSLDPTGVGVVNSPTSFTKSSLVAAVGLANGDYVTVPELGNAPFLISPSGTTAFAGDITMNSGQVAVLQTDSLGFYNVEWFGADGSDSAVDQLTYFNLAAQRSEEEENGDTKRPPIVVPKGDWRVSVPTTYSTTWILHPSAVMYGLPAVAPSNERDTTNLSGSVLIYFGVDQQRTILAGDPTYAVQKYTGKAYTAEVTGNGKLAAGVTGTAQTAARTTPSSGVIGGQFIALSNNPTVPMACYGTYFEAYKTAGAHPDAIAQCLESTIFNDNTLVTQSPYRLLNGGLGATTNLWLTTGGQIQGGTLISGDTSMCIGMKGKEGSEYHRGIVVSPDTISTKEVIASPADHSWDWYDVKSDLVTEVRASRIRGRLANDNAGLIELSVYDSSIGGYRTLYVFGLDNFTAGNARTNLGSPSLPWQNMYVENSPTVTSDERLKKQRGELTNAEKDAALSIARLPRMFKWLSEIAEVGVDSSYLHCSPMAQDVWSAIEKEGLDPSSYGFVRDGERWRIQPQELLWMCMNASIGEIDALKTTCELQQSLIENLVDRVTALENT